MGAHVLKFDSSMQSMMYPACVTLVPAFDVLSCSFVYALKLWTAEATAA